MHLTVMFGVVAVLLLAASDTSHANSAAGTRALARANAILNNASIPQQYKVNFTKVSAILTFL